MNIKRKREWNKTFQAFVAFVFCCSIFSSLLLLLLEQILERKAKLREKNTMFCFSFCCWEREKERERKSIEWEQSWLWWEVMFLQREGGKQRKKGKINESSLKWRCPMPTIAASTAKWARKSVGGNKEKRKNSKWSFIPCGQAKSKSKVNEWKASKFEEEKTQNCKEKPQRWGKKVVERVEGCLKEWERVKNDDEKDRETRYRWQNWHSARARARASVQSQAAQLAAFQQSFQKDKRGKNLGEWARKREKRRK